MSRFGWMQRFLPPPILRPSWRAPELWTLSRVESNGWHTPLGEPFEASPRVNRNHAFQAGMYVLLPLRELDRINRKVAMQEWSAQSSRTVDMLDHDGALDIARWAGATPVGPDDGYPEDVVMILNGMHIHDGDTITRVNGRTIVAPADR